jgi:hypothetical protein
MTANKENQKHLNVVTAPFLLLLLLLISAPKENQKHLNVVEENRKKEEVKQKRGIKRNK